ncbi:MAG: Signal recognition particle receptor FtsY [Gemmatimonadaceae bacterium]|nr:Signal recognition particle receptor FtsY [Gemmatimonadaceae bacterium]
MLFETFHGTDLRQVFEEAHRALGDDCLVIRSDVQRHGSRSRVQLVVASGTSLDVLRKRLDPPAPILPRTHGGRGRSGPFVMALVGPTGAGKTTTLAKLALNPASFGATRPGILSLDTFRVAAIEQIQQYAEIAALPLEVAYDARDIAGALKRLDKCDAILIDTPGRSARALEANGQWQALLRSAAPDETHLVIPVTMRADLLPTVAHQFSNCRLTHLLMTKTDEIADDTMLADACAAIELPVRWLCDGQAVPADVRPAQARILHSLGLTAPRAADRAA